MMNKYTHLVLACAVMASQFFVSSQALAVGGGLVFEIDEFNIPARNNIVTADSLDFTYHACTEIDGPINYQLE